jgi:predicted 3-demethylubiquinone-9 3-methyltransferase (glyoxalase superfamily)
MNSTPIGSDKSEVEPLPRGWLKDRFGLYRQFSPAILGEMLSDHDFNKSERVMEAMLKMKKISILRCLTSTHPTL